MGHAGIEGDAKVSRAFFRHARLKPTGRHRQRQSRFKFLGELSRPPAIARASVRRLTAEHGRSGADQAERLLGSRRGCGRTAAKPQPNPLHRLPFDGLSPTCVVARAPYCNSYSSAHPHAASGRSGPLRLGLQAAMDRGVLVWFRIILEEVLRPLQNGTQIADRLAESTLREPVCASRPLFGACAGQPAGTRFRQHFVLIGFGPFFLPYRDFRGHPRGGTTHPHPRRPKTLELGIPLVLRGLPASKIQAQSPPWSPPSSRRPVRIAVYQIILEDLGPLS